MTVRIFGIRHHGPGSARALGASLAAWMPDAVLVEGPPEADAVLPFAGSPEMRPPVALLGYLGGEPGKAVLYPLATWSPEWVAIRHALAHEVPVKMIDLPVAEFLTDRSERAADESAEPESADPDAADPQSKGAAWAGDPLARLAEVAGYDDPERWWEDMVEQRPAHEPWDAISEAMGELRVDTPFSPWDAEREARREAQMRQHIRAAERAHERVAVVCGAWHAPALAARGPAKPDADLLKGLARTKATVTWVPWTHTRLTQWSGYGAGVASPGWYEHLYVSPDRPVERWMVKVAGLLRDQQIDAPPASVIDAVRLAETLAGMRGRPLAGLAECTEAVRATLTGGYDLALSLIGQKLVVGDAIGEVPPDTPTVPLAADLAAAQRRLRLRPDPNQKSQELDLRKDTDLERSRLLHRLELLGVYWGVTTYSSGTGTFKEAWSLAWDPELSVRVIEASVYGTTVETAATTKAIEDANGAAHMATVTEIVEKCLLADLGKAVEASMSALDRQAAATSDVTELMAAIPALARVLRYGTVRRTDVEVLAVVVAGLVTRVCVGLPAACASLDDDAAGQIAGHLSSVSSSLGTLDDSALRAEWLDALTALSASDTLHGLPAGRCSRILLDAGRLDVDAVSRRLSSALSPGSEPARGAAWVEGFVAGSGLLLVHDRALLGIIDGWLGGVREEAFDDVLPLLRRAFANFEASERRMLADAVHHLGSGSSAGGAGSADDEGVDDELAGAVLPLLELILGDR